MRYSYIQIQLLIEEAIITPLVPDLPPVALLGDPDGDFRSEPEALPVFMAVPLGTPGAAFRTGRYAYVAHTKTLIETPTYTSVGVLAEEADAPPDDGLPDNEADADTLRMAGWGTDEDYFQFE